MARYTDTFTTYWSESDMKPLFAEIDRLQADYESRRPYIDIGSVIAMLNRLTALRSVAMTMMERANG